MSMILKCLQSQLLIEIANLWCFKPAHRGKLKSVMYFCGQLVLGWLTAPSSSSLFPLLNAALQVWILCSQRNGGPCNWWILGKLESLWDLLKNLWRRHQNSHQRVQQTRVSSGKGLLSSLVQRDGEVIKRNSSAGGWGERAGGLPGLGDPRYPRHFNSMVFFSFPDSLLFFKFVWHTMDVFALAALNDQAMSLHPRVWDSMLRVSREIASWHIQH